MKLTGKGASAVKAIATASNRYLAGEISMKGLWATINLWGNVVLKAMIPVVGPFIAPIVGFGTAFYQFWHGEDIFGNNGFSFNPGGKSIDEWIKDFFTELFGG